VQAVGDTIVSWKNVSKAAQPIGILDDRYGRPAALQILAIEHRYRCGLRLALHPISPPKFQSVVLPYLSTHLSYRPNKFRSFDRFSRLLKNDGQFTVRRNSLKLSYQQKISSTCMNFVTVHFNIMPSFFFQATKTRASQIRNYAHHGKSLVKYHLRSDCHYLIIETI